MDTIGAGPGEMAPLRWGIGRKSNFFTVKARKLKLGNRINVDVQISNLKLVSKNSFQLSWKRGYNGKKKVFLGRVNIFSNYKDLALLTCILKDICWSMQRSSKFSSSYFGFPKF